MARDNQILLEQLNRWFEKQTGVAIAYSGGMDSAFLALAAKRHIGDSSKAYIVVSEVMPEVEIESARETATKHGLNLTEVPLSVLHLEAFLKHPPDRCYLCKKHVFSTLLSLKPAEWTLADGSNLDDRSDHRPGRRALAELGVASPLEIAGFDKNAIRETLSAWDAPELIRPPGPCLATRIPFETPVTLEKLRQIQSGESILREAGFPDSRLRHHGSLARIEVPAADVERAMAELPGFIRRIQALGFIDVIIDSRGYRRGSMNSDL